MKRWMATFAIAALAGSALVGCTQPEGDTSKPNSEASNSTPTDPKAGTMETKTDEGKTDAGAGETKTDETKTGG